MKIKALILEDDPSKKERLLRFLSGSDLFDEVSTALCTDHAKKEMSREKFDLLIVDIVVPKTLAGTKHEDNSIALLEEIDDGVGEMIPPDFVLPLSSSKDLSQSAQDFFLGRPWGIVPYEDTNDDAVLTIQRVAEYILREKLNNATPSNICDVLIVTALYEPEFTAVQELPFNWGPIEPLDAQHLMRKGTFKNSGVDKTVIATFCHRMGPVQAAILVTKALNFKPKIVLMAGICAGYPSRANIGDVVAAEISWDWQSGKYIDKNGAEAFEIAPHQLDIPDALRSQLMILKTNTQFWSTFARESQGLNLPMPKLVLGPMATGSSVLADERVSSRIKDNQHKNVAGLDMETYGVYAAVQATAPNTLVVSLKSVCDKGDKRKDDQYQAYAAGVSAKTVEQFLVSCDARILAQNP
jgi:nucleoside phosphorylase